MFLNHFGLTRDPFPLYPSQRFVFMSTAFEETMAHLVYGLEHEEDIILITGPIGTGKTLAAQNLLANLNRIYRSVLINVTQLDYAETLKLILGELGAPVVGAADRGDLLHALKEQVRLAQAMGNKILIVVDEAQNLAAHTLEGLRMLTNLGQPQGQAVQLVLIGQPNLEETIKLPELAQLRQRIRVHYRLETLNRQETEAYIGHRLKVAGAQRPFFQAKAIDLIHRASSGVPRLVNVLCSRALISAYVANKHEVAAEHVDLTDLAAATGVDQAASRATPLEARPAPPAARAPVAVRADPPAAAAAPIYPQPGPRPAVPLFPPALPMRRPFEPRVVLGDRKRRASTWFVFGMLLIVIVVVVIFSLQSTGSMRRTEAALAAPAGATGRASAVKDTTSTGSPAAFAPTTASTAFARVAAGSWVVHVQSHRDAARRDAALAELIEARFPAFARAEMVEDRQWQRIYVGPYRTLEEAREAERRLRDQRLTSHGLVVRFADATR